MPIWLIVTIALAFSCLFYESDWMRVRLLVGAISQLEPPKTIRLWQYRRNGTCGITQKENYNPYHITRNDTILLPFHAGITEPVCGWDWLLSHEHPIIENRIEISAHNCKHSIHLCDNPEVDYGRIMKDVCSIAFRANLRRNGHKVKKHKGRTFNPNYGLTRV